MKAKYIYNPLINVIPQADCISHTSHTCSNPFKDCAKIPFMAFYSLLIADFISHIFSHTLNSL